MPTGLTQQVIAGACANNEENEKKASQASTCNMRMGYVVAHPGKDGKVKSERKQQVTVGIHVHEKQIERTL